jgi:hypothetical protein
VCLISDPLRKAAWIFDGRFATTSGAHVFELETRAAYSNDVLMTKPGIADRGDKHGGTVGEKCPAA